MTNLREIEQKTVVDLLNSLPDDGLLFIGGGVGAKNRIELIEHVKRRDDVGKHVIEVYMNYLRSLKDRRFPEGM
jgi:hypothetical protein